LAIVIDLLYRFSRTHPGGFLLAWLFKNMNFVLPLERLRETDTLLAFYHPKPAYPFHVILVPKRMVESIETLSAEDQGFLSDLFSIVQDLVSEFRLAQNGYRLIANGGKYQEFGLLHFHLISDDRPEQT